jgi:hypothetical protein
MAELRLVGVSEDGERLVLVDDDGAEHTIVIDDRLRAGVHGHLSRLGQLTMALESRISPREIQDRVRAGESADHVAQTAGVPLERVLRFIGPVLREREHVAEQALRARLAGTGGPTSLLGDLVARAATRRGVDADAVAWDSARREDHLWVVTTTWPDDTDATWVLDLPRHQATPLDAAARRISGVPEPGRSETATSSQAGARDFPDFTDSAEFARFDADDPVDAGIDTPEPILIKQRSGRASVHRLVPRAAPANGGERSFVEEPPAEIEGDTARDENAADADDADAETGGGAQGDGPAVVVADDESSSVDVGEPGGTTPATPGGAASRPQSPRSSRRAAVPKWDDIMFGMKPKDGS